ncbi:MAG: trimeric intracellular cation channel family protein [Clostridiales bacterium]|nr:trimeric intracellular cation channel family protein [Clostridiales bacterium]
MSITEIIRFTTDMSGAVACAMSGSLVAIDHGLDLFGVVFVGCVTATGGGIMRDIFLGRLPPRVFTNYIYMSVALATSLIVFVVAYVMRESYKNTRERVDRINNFFDALGLGAFSAGGVEAAISSGYVENWALCILLGMVTGVGGGMLRDIMTNETPYVLRKRIYAIASLAGSTVYYHLHIFHVGAAITTISSIVIVVFIRMAATAFKWNMPRVPLK